MTSQTFTFDGRTIAFNKGETLAAAILRAGGATPLAYFCGIGSCQSCLVWCGERRVEACLTLATSGAIVSSANE